MTLQNSDSFVVKRSSVNYSVKSEKLVATLQDSDLMVVGRGSTPYKITGKEVKDSLGGGGGGGGIFPSDNDLTINPSVPGSGTLEDPYILATRTAAPAGSTVFTSETITFTEQPPNTDVIWTDNSTGSGTRFSQPVTKTDTNGTWSAELQYADAPDSTEDIDYTGNLQIGVLHFRWQVDQKLNDRIPTEVDSVNLVDTGLEDGPRFTDQSFVFTSVVTDGAPLPTKTIEAHVDGSLRVKPETTEIVGVNKIAQGDWTSAKPTANSKSPERNCGYISGTYFMITGTNVAQICGTPAMDGSATGINGMVGAVAVLDPRDDSEIGLALITDSGRVRLWKVKDGQFLSSDVAGSDARSDASYIRNLMWAGHGFYMELASTAGYPLSMHYVSYDIDTETYGSWQQCTVSGATIEGQRTSFADYHTGKAWIFGTYNGSKMEAYAKAPVTGGGAPTSFYAKAINPAESATGYIIDAQYDRVNKIRYFLCSGGVSFYQTAVNETWNQATSFGDGNLSNACNSMSVLGDEISFGRENGTIQPVRFSGDADSGIYGFQNLTSVRPGLACASRCGVMNGADNAMYGNDNVSYRTASYTELTLANDSGLSNFAAGDSVVQDSGFGAVTSEIVGVGTAENSVAALANGTYVFSSAADAGGTFPILFTTKQKGTSLGDQLMKRNLDQNGYVKWTFDTPVYGQLSLYMEAVNDVDYRAYDTNDQEIIKQVITNDKWYNVNSPTGAGIKFIQFNQGGSSSTANVYWYGARLNGIDAGGPPSTELTLA